MKPSAHHIKSKVFEVSFNDESESLRFQKSFSDFIRNELVEITEKCLSEYDGPTLKIINKLELNLGDIPYDGYEKILMERYEEALMHALFNKLEFEGPDKEEGENSTASILFMIRHFLLKGYMPWNYDENNWESFNQMYEHAAAIDGNALINELNELLPAVQSRTRLIHQLEEQAIQNTVKRIEPSQSQLILNYHKNWMTTERKHSLFGESTNQLSKSFWLFIFNYLYEERGSYFNTKAFLISTLKQIAGHFNLSYEEVIGHLRIVHQEVANTRSNNLHHLLEEMLKLDVATLEKDVESQSTDEDTKRFKTSDLSHYLKNGKWPSSVDTYASFAEVFVDLAASEPENLIRLINEVAKDLSKLDKMVNLLGEQRSMSLYSLMQPHSYEAFVAYDQFFRELVLDTSIRGTANNLTSILVQTLSETKNDVLNHQRLLKNLLQKIASQSGSDYQMVVKHVYERLQLDNVKLGGTQTGRFLEKFLLSEMSEQSTRMKPLRINEIDVTWIEESIVSGQVHPLLEKEGYLSIQDVLKFFAKEDHKAFDSFIKQRLDKKKFIENFSEILDANLFHQLQPAFINKKKDWEQLFRSIEEIPPSQHLHQKALVLALRSLTLKWMYGAFTPNGTNTENALMRISSEFGVDFNLLLKALIQLSDQTMIRDWKDEVVTIANKLGIQSGAKEHLSIEVDAQLGKSENQYLEKQLAIVLSAINGIVNREELELLGFRSADEVLRQLMKAHPGLLKEKLCALSAWGQSFLGIGREIPISTFYALLSMLNGTGGKQVITILRKLEIQLNEGSQSINRFLNITRSLALYRLSEQTFSPGSFTDDFVQLIKDSSPAIYTQVIPVLSKNISMISLPAKGNVDEVITNLEAQLYHVDDSNFQMDEKVLSKLIIEEYFGQSLEKESTIIPYFDETADVVYDEIYIENAGLVILSSYFSILFERLSLLENGKFLSSNKQEMAVLLLQYLMLDEPPLNEHHLPLNKILCGLDVGHPIRTDIQINRKDREVIHGLIDAVIGYWSAIGHSTIEGFQGSWLWRKGKLENKEECWELKVEQNSYDMLLDRLPFTLSPIKLSWMEKPLIVEWR
ncbi:MAG: contractile injection system tape measure protein [Ekhidna sp.]